MKKMKRIIIAISIACLAGFSARAQEVSTAAQEESSAMDSIVYRPADALDESLRGKSIFTVIDKQGDNVTVSQSASIKEGMKSHVANNSRKHMNGYRVRIFFDNKQNSRGASEAALNRFKGAYPGIPAYRSFTSPFFKVTVGDFRTKSEAAQLLQSVKSSFPSAFIVKEQINYPAADRHASYVVDTIRVIKATTESSTIQ